MKRYLIPTTLFVLAALLGVALGSTPGVAAAQGEVHGCWYEPPNPPKCDICGWSCGSGQQCCTIEPQ